MVEEYCRYQTLAGNISKLAGFGATIYGIVTQDLEVIAGGAVLGYIGKTLTDEANQKWELMIQKERNRIIRDGPTLDSHVE